MGSSKFLKKLNIPAPAPIVPTGPSVFTRAFIASTKPFTVLIPAITWSDFTKLPINSVQLLDNLLSDPDQLLADFSPLYLIRFAISYFAINHLFYATNSIALYSTNFSNK